MKGKGREVQLKPFTDSTGWKLKTLNTSRMLVLIINGYCIVISIYIVIIAQAHTVVSGYIIL